MAQILLSQVTDGTAYALRTDAKELGISPGEYVNRLVTLRRHLERENTPECLAAVAASALLVAT